MAAVVTAVASLITAFSLMLTALTLLVPLLKRTKSIEAKADAIETKTDAVHVLVNSTADALKKREEVLTRALKAAGIDVPPDDEAMRPGTVKP